MIYWSNNKIRVYVLWYYIYINDQSYELNKIINKDVVVFHKVRPSRKYENSCQFLLCPYSDTTSYNKKITWTKGALHIY